MTLLVAKGAIQSSQQVEIFFPRKVSVQTFQLTERTKNPTESGITHRQSSKA